MVVCNLLVIKHRCLLAQFLTHQRLGELFVRSDSCKNLRHFRIYIVRQKSGVHPWVGGQFLLIQALNNLKRLLGAVTKTLVALHLQACKVKQFGAALLAILSLHTRNLKRLAFYICQGLFCVFFLIKPALFYTEGYIAIHSFQLPIRLRHKVFNLLLPLDHKRKRRCLHTPHAENALAVGELYGVESGGVYTKKPVSYGTGTSCRIERVKLRGVIKVVKALSYSLFSK